MTNREWINTLPNEQLVKFFRTFKQNSCSCCTYFSPSNNDKCGFCFKGQVEWLNQEHDFESFEERLFNYCV